MSSLISVQNGAGLERVHYFPRQLITADDMTVEQGYFRQKLRRHNRFLHGWGVVCGLNVTAASTEVIPWQVKIDGGYALSPQGDEIYVAEPVCLDLAKCGLATVTDPCEPSRPPSHVPIQTDRLFVAIKYVECEARPVRVHPTGCACDEADCEYSRIRDDFKIECLAELPPSHQPDPTPPLICALHSTRQSPSCQPCPPEPWVVLAQVTLPPSPTSHIADSNIDNFTVRQQLYSTAQLQEQLIDCCCTEPGPPPTPTPPPPTPTPRPVRVSRIDPPDRTKYKRGDLQNDPLPSHIRIEFDKNLKHTTVNTNTIQVTVARPSDPSSPVEVPGTVSYDDATSSAQFTPDRPFEKDLVGDGDYNYRVTVSGNDPNPIRDVDGLALDGNADGAPGGNHISRFNVNVYYHV